MSSKLVKVGVLTIILSFYASFLFLKIVPSAADNDAGLYITDGKVIWETTKVFRQNIYSFTVPEYPVYDHHWLSSVVFYLVTETVGFKGLTIFKAMILLSAFLVLFSAALKKADFWPVAVFSLPTVLILTQRVRIRPEMFSYLFIALFLWLLFDFEKHPEKRRIYWLIPLQFLWINFHIFFFVGVAVVGGFLFEKVILKSHKHFFTKFLSIEYYKTLWGDPVIKKLTLILPILVLACFLNPNGLEGMLAPFKTHSYESFIVSENQPFFNFKAHFLSWDFLNSEFVPMILVFLFSFIFGFRKTPLFFLLAGVGGALAGLIHVRLVTLFALVFLPAVSANFNETFIATKDWMQKRRPKASRVLGWGAITFIAIALPVKAYRLNTDMVAKGFSGDWGVGLTRYANDSAIFFKESGLRGPIFNDYDIGGYIIYHLFPGERVFVDNNGADSYPVSFFNDVYGLAFSREDKWREVEERYGLNTIFISLRNGSPNTGSFLWNRLHDPLWALVYVDTYAVILVKQMPENRKIIEKFNITPENVEGKIEPLLKSDNVMDRLVGARVLYLVGREDLSTSHFKKIVAKYPQNSWAWLFMGAIKTYKNNGPDLVSAIVFLENAVNMGQKTSEGYTWLGLAYFKFGQFEKAEETFQKALWLDPGHRDATDYLAQLQQYLVE